MFGKLFVKLCDTRTSAMSISARVVAFVVLWVIVLAILLQNRAYVNIREFSIPKGEHRGDDEVLGDPQQQQEHQQQQDLQNLKQEIQVLKKQMQWLQKSPQLQKEEGLHYQQQQQQQKQQQQTTDSLMSSTSVKADKMGDILSQMHASRQSWKIPPTLPGHLQGVMQDNPELIQHIRENWIIPPGDGLIKNLLPDFNQTSQFGQPNQIDHLLSKKRDGFVIECGAYDGLLHSNSLFFEVYRNWSGILIEAVPSYFKRLLRLNRSMFALNACLSPTNVTSKLKLSVSGIGSGITSLIPEGQKKKTRIETKTTIEVQCFPLYSVLAALGVYHVDYFSLDVEGAELSILKTIPFGRVDIDTFTIETRVMGNEVNGRKKKEAEIMELLKPIGYRFVKSYHLDMFVSKL